MFLADRIIRQKRLYESQSCGAAKMKRSPNIREALEFAWPVFKRNIGLFTGILLTMFGAWVALEIVVIAGQRFGILLWVAAHLAFLIFVAGIEVGFLKVCLILYDRGQPTFSDSFAYLSQGP